MAVPLTVAASGPSLAMTGPSRDGTYTLQLRAGDYRDATVRSLDREHLAAQLAYLVIRLDVDAHPSTRHEEP